MQENSLDPDGNPIALGPVVIRTPGIAGVVTYSEPSDDAVTRGPALGTEELLAALAEADAREDFTIELKDLAGTVPETTTDGIDRGENVAGPEIEVEVPAPAENERQLLLLIAEDGVASWHFPVEPDSDVDTVERGRAMLAYRLPGSIIPVDAEEDGTSRGIISTVASKVLKFIVFPLLDPVLKKAGNHFAAKFEEDKRLQRWRTFTPDDYVLDGSDAIDPDTWDRLARGRSLLFIHGTGAMAHNAFDQLPRDVLIRLSEHYGGRVFALDHYTISVDPTENVRRAVEALPEGIELEVDVICHSRGGLVARELAERGGSPGVHVKRVVMVGTPNAGTAIAARENLRSWLDTMTNVAQFIPDNPVVDIIAVVLNVAKQLALGVYEGLDGLTAMDPKGDYLRALNVDGDSDTEYFAIAADYEPQDGSPLKRTHDLAMDVLFSNEQNDLVVPTAGVSTVAGLSRFEPKPLVLDGKADVSHFTYFGTPAVTKQLVEWLEA